MFQLVCAVYPEGTYSQRSNGEITIAYYTPIGSTKIVFFLDTPFQVITSAAAPESDINPPVDNSG